MSRKLIALLVPCLLLCGCMARRGPAATSGDGKGLLRIRQPGDVPPDHLARLQDILRERAATTETRGVELATWHYWLSFVYLDRAGIEFLRDPDWAAFPPEKRKQQALRGHFRMAGHRSMGPLGLIYGRLTNAAFDEEGRNRGYDQLRWCLWGLLWLDAQRGVPYAKKGLVETRSAGPLWSAFGYGRQGARRSLRLLFIPIPLGKAK